MNLKDHPHIFYGHHTLVPCIPTLEQCHETAGNLIALQSRRLIDAVDFKRAIRNALELKDATDAEKLAAIKAALKDLP